MTTTRAEDVPTDGGSMPAHLALPDDGRGPGLLLIQEIFGVNDYVRAVADRLAELGYVTLAPQMFWRLEEDFEVNGSGPEAMEPAMTKMQQFDGNAGMTDLAAALDHLRGLDDVDGPVGVIGFCFGGSMAYLAGAHLDPDAVVSYYGSMVAGSLDAVDGLTCPTLFHFGTDDPFLPMSDVEQIQEATAGMDHVEIVLQEGAGHAFDNHLNEMFSNPEAAAAAWERTTGFLARHLPT